MLGRRKDDTVVEMSKSVCIPDTQVCMQVCRLGPGGHTSVHGKPVCARYKLAYTLGKWACKLVLRSKAFELDIPACIRACILACILACTLAYTPACIRACIPACIPACTPACTPACIPACIPGRRSSLADDDMLDQQQRQQLKWR
jgi:hypothetical protein